jgi:hypothetical protein
VCRFEPVVQDHKSANKKETKSGGVIDDQVQCSALSRLKLLYHFYHRGDLAFR